MQLVKYLSVISTHFRLTILLHPVSHMRQLLIFCSPFSVLFIENRIIEMMTPVVISLFVQLKITAANVGISARASTNNLGQLSCLISSFK